MKYYKKFQTVVEKRKTMIMMKMIIMIEDNIYLNQKNSNQQEAYPKPFRFLGQI